MIQQLALQTTGRAFEVIQSEVLGGPQEALGMYHGINDGYRMAALNPDVDDILQLSRLAVDEEASDPVNAAARETAEYKLAATIGAYLHRKGAEA